MISAILALTSVSWGNDTTNHVETRQNTGMCSTEFIMKHVPVVCFGKY